MTADRAHQLMMDHPGWVICSDDGGAQRAFRSGDTVWTVDYRRGESTFQPVVEIVHQGQDSGNVRPMIDTFDAGTLPAPIRHALKIDATTRIHRIRNPDVWDAMLMPILRHRIAITDAANRYRAFCIRYGTTVSTKLGTSLLPPRPETAAALDDDPVAVGRRMHVIRAIAGEYLRLRPDQAQPSPAVLFHMAQGIHGIGEASAARIVADTTGDFTFHELAGFGSRKHWLRDATELVGQVPDLRMLWKSCTYHQRSTAIALTIHQRLTDPHRAEAADNGVLRSLIKDMARPCVPQPQASCALHAVTSRAAQVS